MFMTSRRNRGRRPISGRLIRESHSVMRARLTSSEHAISSIVLDPFSIEHVCHAIANHLDSIADPQTGRCAVWTTTRDSIGAWDGLLSVDWIGENLVYE